MTEPANSPSGPAAGDNFARSACPVAVTLDLLGDKWTLLVVRDLFRGVARYNDFLKSPENIPTNILAERLKRLEEADIVEKRQYQDRPKRFEYLLTTKGFALGPVVKEIARWGVAHYPGTIVFRKP